MIRLLLLLPIALLVPAYAEAATFNDLVATTIAYSKWILMIVGFYAFYKGTSDKVTLENGAKKTAAFKLVALVTLGPSILLSFLGYFGFDLQNVQIGSSMAAGKSYLEYMMAHVGLLTCAMLGNQAWFILLVSAALFGGLAFETVRGLPDTDEAFKNAAKYFVSAGIIFTVFCPAKQWQRTSTNNAQELIREVQAHMSKAPPVHGGLIGPVSSSTAMLSTISKSTQAMLPIESGSAKVPFVLDDINSGMDDVVAQISSSISARGFARYGMAGAEGMMSDIQGTLPSYISGSLRRRLKVFMDVCAFPLLEGQMNSGDTASKWASNPRQMALSFDPIAPTMANLKWYDTHGSHACSMMVKGGYNWSGSAISPGPEYPLGLEDEIFANYAFNDPRIRALFPQIKSLSDMAVFLPQIKEQYSSVEDWRALVQHIFSNSVEAWYGRMSDQMASLSVGGVASSASLLSKDLRIGMSYLIGAGKSVTGAGSAQFVSMSLPIYMGAIQMLLLGLFPITFALALLPGRASTIGWWLGTLLWAKSYIISWAMISNLDHWFSTAMDFSHTSSLGTVGVTAGTKLAMVHAIQNLQMWSPWFMAFVIFGAKVAGGHNAAKGAGAV